MGLNPADPGQVAAGMAAAFEDLSIPYLVGGSVASTIHGEPRGTLDVDFAVHMEPSQAEALCARIEPDFFVDVQAVREAARAKRMFNAIHAKLFVKADVHVRRASGHSRAEMERAIRVDLPGGGASIRVATPEDTALRKLWWFEQGGQASDRQWSDVLGILRAVRSEIDEEYMHTWAEELGIVELLRRALGSR